MVIARRGGCFGIMAAAVPLKMIHGGVMEQRYQAGATRQNQKVQVLIAQQRSLNRSSRR